MDWPSFREFDDRSDCPKCGYHPDDPGSLAGPWVINHDDGLGPMGIARMSPECILVKCPNCKATRKYHPLDAETPTDGG